jgi:hypothetical protein
VFESEEKYENILKMKWASCKENVKNKRDENTYDRIW